MRSLPILLFFGFFVVLIHSRPSQSDDNNGGNFEEAEYSDDRPVADESDSRLNDAPSGSELDQNGQLLETGNSHLYVPRYSAENRSDRSHPISDYKQGELENRDVQNDKSEELNSYKDVNNYGKQRPAQCIGDKDAFERQMAARYVTSRNVNYYRNNHNNLLMEDPLNKRETESSKGNPNNLGEMLFEPIEQRSQPRNEFDNNPVYLNQRHLKYYPQILPDNKEFMKKQRDLYFRDRRETSNTNVEAKVEADTNVEADNEPNKNENEEMAIRRHVKKLSSNELDELMNSLSDDKKQLLKAIIESSDNDSVNKREITKKAGAVEENVFEESGLSDSSSIHSEKYDEDVSSTNQPLSSESTETSKLPDAQTENTDLANSKSTETDHVNDEALNSQKEESVKQKESVEILEAGAEKTQDQITSDKESKTENKRETNIDDLADIVSFEDPKEMDSDWLSGDSKDQLGLENEELTQFLDDDESLKKDDGSKLYKRDVGIQAEEEAKMKSLAESFPISATYDDSAGPLIRVKRKNEPLMKKRSAAVLPDAKVGYFPYRDEDEDNDEGNEFDDNGFYDRSPNFSQNEANNPAKRDTSSSKLNSASSNDNIKDTESLGSDTDGILSGVEGVDETLMFSGGSRNRRTTEEISDVLDETNSIHNAKSLSEGTKTADLNALTYQESDSFGPLPGNNDGESGRYKRIRRVKQSHPENSST